MKKILGLDLGTNSIGWAVVNADENGTAAGDGTYTGIVERTYRQAFFSGGGR